MDKKSFLFYLNWEQQVDLLSDTELRSFIKNLCRYTRGEEINLKTREEQICWLGILPALEINKEKYEKKIEANRVNGKLGGAPKGNQNARKSEKQPKSNENNPNNLITEKREEVSDTREMINQNSNKLKENRKEKNDTSKKENNQDVNTSIISGMTEENSTENEFTFGNLENNLKEFEDPNKSIGLVIKSDRNSTTSQVRKQSNISESTTQNDKESSKIGEMRDAMNEWFEDYPSWESDLYTHGIDNFIRKTSGKYKTDSSESREIINYFLSEGIQKSVSKLNK